MVDIIIIGILLVFVSYLIGRYVEPRARKKFNQNQDKEDMSFEQFMQLKDLNTLLELWATTMTKKFGLDYGLIEGGFDYPRYLKLYEKTNEVDYLARVEIEINRHDDNTMNVKYYHIKRYYDQYNSVVEELNESFRNNDILDHVETVAGLIWCYRKIVREIEGLKDYNIGLMDRLGES